MKNSHHPAAGQPDPAIQPPPIPGLPGYPNYPVAEDIYHSLKEEKDIDPENISQKKSPAEKDRKHLGLRDDHALDYSLDHALNPLGEDLDVPGAELDDQEEDIGNEDEENNYYSLGGDNHTDLEESHGE